MGLCGGNKKQKSNSTSTVTTAPQTTEESDQQRLATYMQQLDLWHMGYETFRDDKGQLQARSRALTADEEKQQAQDREISDIAMRKLKGEVTPEEQALIDKTYGSAIETGKSDVRAEFDRALNELQIGEDRGYSDIQKELTRGNQDIQGELQRGTQDIDKQFRTDAAERGLSQSATPIFGERAQTFQRFGEDINKASTRLGEDTSKMASQFSEDVARNKRLLGEDLTRNVTDLETSLLGAKSASTLDVMKSGQLFSQALREFQSGLQQQSFLNRQMIGESAQNLTMGLGNLRSRNYTQTGTGTTTTTGGGGGFLGAISGISSLMGGGGGLLQGLAKMRTP